MKRAMRIALALSMLMVVCAASGCMRVKPWQRANLAREDMQFDSDPMRSALMSHIEFSKEGSMPASGAAGGGCGCN